MPARFPARGVFGYTPDRRYIIVVYEEFDDSVYPKTAYEVPEP
jgi:hypothetical protein